MSTFSKQTFRNLFVLAKYFTGGHVPDGRKLRMRMTNIFLYICFRLNLLPQVSSSIELKQCQTYYTFTLRQYNLYCCSKPTCRVYFHACTYHVLSCKSRGWWRDDLLFVQVLFWKVTWPRTRRSVVCILAACAVTRTNITYCHAKSCGVGVAVV